MDEPEGIYLSAPFQEHHRILQLWGVSPGYYTKFHIGSVPLKGHNGVDFDLPAGSMVLAVDDGEVIELGYDRSGYGRYLVLQHWWGESLYAHLQEFNVDSGQQIYRGQTIGFAGNSGVSPRPHLHLGIRIIPYDRFDGWGGYTNPLPFLDPKFIQQSSGPQT
jgi:murein DD-endopeptidase MepM/ murein hydrolase activator NlpD